MEDTLWLESLDLRHKWYKGRGDGTHVVAGESLPGGRDFKEAFAQSSA